MKISILCLKRRKKGNWLYWSEQILLSRLGKYERLQLSKYNPLCSTNFSENVIKILSYFYYPIEEKNYTYMSKYRYHISFHSTNNKILNHISIETIFCWCILLLFLKFENNSKDQTSNCTLLNEVQHLEPNFRSCHSKRGFLCLTFHAPNFAFSALSFSIKFLFLQISMVSTLFLK